ncbi:ATP-binding protein [Paenibacillus agricola]|uniref:ATP-binding protein n=1 Tax=Paenibacillus agricola TaxID=2716264 RepID=UPI001A9D668F|nr:ATP-binding protein [Paenibacillus agricola]
MKKEPIFYRGLEEAAEQILITISQLINANTFFVASNETEPATIIKARNQSEHLVEAGAVWTYVQSCCALVINQLAQGLTLHEVNLATMEIGNSLRNDEDGCTLIGVPITLKSGHIYGVLCAMDRNRGCFKEMDMTLLTSMAGFLSHVIELEQTVAHKARFLDMISHEIRTPLNGMLGMTTLLQDTGLTEEQKEYAMIIQTSGQSLLAVLNDVLDLSKIEAGKMSLDIQPFDIHGCIEDVLDLFASKMDTSKIELLSDVDSNIPAMLVGDSTRIRQVLVNLVSNALKFTEAGEIIVTVKLAGSNEGDSYSSNEGNPQEEELTLLVYVKDTGAGIPLEKMDLLFQSFSQIPSSKPGMHKEGTGLGLMISKQLVELMQGRIWAESSLGQGSTFCFTLQVQDGQMATNDEEKQRLYDKKVLIVDDHETMLTTLKRTLEKWGMSVETTTSAAEALVWLEQGDTFDMAIIDQNMPEMDGLLLAKRIRESYGLSDLPILMLAAFGKDFYTSADSDLYNTKLKKPVNTRRLLAEIIACLRGRP